MTSPNDYGEAVHGRIRLAVWLLAAGQAIVWAGLFYSFAALLLSWEEGLGWAKTDLTLGLTAAVLVSAILSPVAGRIIDAGNGRLLLTSGCFGGAAMLALLSTVDSQASFIGLWALIGVAQAASLYEPCFAFVTRTMGHSARGAITRISLCAGFASTIAFPSGAWLADVLGWRGAVLIFALAVATVGAPLMFAGATILHRGDRAEHKPEHKASNRDAVRAAMARPAFWLLAFAFPMIGLNHGLLLNHILPILADRGLEQTLAVTVASVIGPMQVAGRLAMMRVEHRISAMTMTVVCFAGITIASLLLLNAGASPVLAFGFAALQGAAYGLTNILKPVVTAETLGRAGFGSISGLLAVPYLASFAIAPFAGAWLWQIGGYNLAITGAGAMAFLGLLAVLLLSAIYRRSAYAT
ncbi:MFS transporter [Nitratireductor sp. XY-223]|uniref:MFS transporter n=1 Tax=Nitratireductor sp. XY-223 TaxID=2561926 RepID=UPI0010AB0393|nr:MFS transporter [Nitratireductor sp. XY-223]